MWLRKSWNGQFAKSYLQEFPACHFISKAATQVTTDSRHDWRHHGRPHIWQQTDHCILKISKLFWGYCHLYLHIYYLFWGIWNWRLSFMGLFCGHQSPSLTKLPQLTGGRPCISEAETPVNIELNFPNLSTFPSNKCPWWHLDFSNNGKCFRLDKVVFKCRW